MADKVYGDIVKGQIGLVDVETAIDKFSIHFSEWWNGEGIDHTIMREKEKDLKLSLSGVEMEYLVAIWIKTGYIDIKEVKKISKQIKKNKLFFDEE